jgi:plastocyanin
MKRVYCIPLLLALLATACGSSGGSEIVGKATEVPAPVAQVDDDCANLTASSSVEIVAIDNYFAPECPIVKSSARIEVRNLGALKHSFTISEGEFGTSPWVLNIDPIEGGKTKSSKGEIGEVLDPGTYEFFCKYHGGMDGVLEVVPAFEG